MKFNKTSTTENTQQQLKFFFFIITKDIFMSEHVIQKQIFVHSPLSFIVSTFFATHIMHFKMCVFDTVCAYDT